MTEWRSVVGYENLYEVSDDGRVRSLAHNVRSKTGWRLVRGRELKLSAGRRYVRVSLSRSNNIVQRHVHILVLEAFVGPRPSGMWGLHRDDNQANNVLGNLYWGTPSENRYDTVRNGNHRLANRVACERAGHVEWRFRPNGGRYCGACAREDSRERKRAARRTRAHVGHPSDPFMS